LFPSGLGFKYNVVDIDLSYLISGWFFYIGNMVPRHIGPRVEEVEDMLHTIEANSLDELCAWIGIGTFTTQVHTDILRQ